MRPRLRDKACGVKGKKRKRRVLTKRTLSQLLDDLKPLHNLLLTEHHLTSAFFRELTPVVVIINKRCKRFLESTPSTSCLKRTRYSTSTMTGSHCVTFSNKPKTKISISLTPIFHLLRTYISPRREKARFNSQTPISSTSSIQETDGWQPPF